MKEYTVTGKYHGFVTHTINAETPEEAMQKYLDEHGGNVSLCWSCSLDIDHGDMYEFEVELDGETVLKSEDV